MIRNQKFTNALLNAIPSAAALLNEQGDIVTVNSLWCRDDHKSPYFGLKINGVNYFDTLAEEAKSGSDFGLKMILGLRSVIDKKVSEFTLFYASCAEDTLYRYKMNIVRAEGEESDWLIVKHEQWGDAYAMEDAYVVSGQHSLPTYLEQEGPLGKTPWRSSGRGISGEKRHNTTEYESELEKSLHEKEILLQEVHHRVKNNLAVISGLIELQVMDSSHKKVNLKLKQVQNRILSIAQIHESIYQNGNLVNVEMDSYFRQFAEHMTYFDDDDWTLHLDLEQVRVNLNLAVPFGLLINELMILISQNEDCKNKHVYFKLRQPGDEIELEMSTDCLQLDSSDDLKECNRFNLKIIHVLLQQLNATFEFSNRSAKALKMTFKNTNVRGSSSLHF